jgi:hypothetical protein
MAAVWGAKSFGKSEIVRGWDSGCPRSRAQLRVRLESRLRDGNDGPRVSVAQSRFFVAAEPQSKFQKLMKLILEKLRSLLRSGPGTPRVFWQQMEFTFSTIRSRR